MQAEFYVELGEGADRLEIPWASPEDPANRYHDLKAEPEKLDRIEEARAQAPLRDFLAGVNAPASAFATAKCDTWTTSEFTDGERADFPEARAKAAGYIDLVFARPDFNFHRLHYEQLARRLRELLRRDSTRARAELCLRHCYFYERQAWGFYLTVFLYGYGADAAEAAREWATGLRAVVRALAQISEALAAALAQAEAGGGRRA